MAISLPQTIREDSTGEFPQEKVGALLCDELEEGWPEDILRHSYGSYHLAKYAMPPLRPIKWGTRMRGCSMRTIER